METKKETDADRLDEFHNGRKAAAAEIDIETCKIRCLYVPDFDPYPLGLPEHLTTRIDLSKDLFVRSPGSGGWVWEGDLSEAEAKALHARIERERRAREDAQTKIDAVIQAAVSKARPLAPHEADDDLIRKVVLNDPAVAALCDDEETKKLLLRQGLLKVVDNHVRRHGARRAAQARNLRTAVGPPLPF